LIGERADDVRVFAQECINLMSQPTAFITGGAGFIGSNFTRHILDAMPDLRVVVFDKLTYAGNRANLSAIEDDSRFRFVQGDICDEAAVRSAMEGCVWVINFAAETHVDRSIVEPGAFIRTDVQGTYVLLEAARDLGVRRFIQISTDEVYGNAESPEGVSRPSLETDALKPLSPYAASKAGADRLAFSYWATYGLPVIVTRCSNNYGPYQYPEKQLPLFITNALADRPLPVYGDGRNTRDWIHVDDHARALEAILTAPDDLVLGEVFNIGSSQETSIIDNANAVLQVLGKSQDLIAFVPDRLGHVRRHAVDADKIGRQLGWEPTVPFHDGLAATVAWYREHPQWLEHVLGRRDAFLDRALSLAVARQGT
jgi:dTDP-glucose 4,6-dehydratase